MSNKCEQHGCPHNVCDQLHAWWAAQANATNDPTPEDAPKPVRVDKSDGHTKPVTEGHAKPVTEGHWSYIGIDPGEGEPYVKPRGLPKENPKPEYRGITGITPAEYMAWLEAHGGRTPTPLYLQEWRVLHGQMARDLERAYQELRDYDALVEANERKMDAGRDNLLLDLEHRLDAARQEIARLKEGRFTPDELQNLCHNLDSSQECAFKHGCEEYQRKLFGKEGAMEQAYRRAAAVVIYYQPRGYNSTQVVCAMERDAAMHLGRRVDLTDPSKPQVVVPVYSAAELNAWQEQACNNRMAKQVLTSVAKDEKVATHRETPEYGLKELPKGQGKELPLAPVQQGIAQSCGAMNVFDGMMFVCEQVRGHAGPHIVIKKSGSPHTWEGDLLTKEIMERIAASVQESTLGLATPKEADTCQSVETLDGIVLQCGLWAGHQGPHIAKGKFGDRYRWHDDANRQEAKCALEEACRTVQDVTIKAAGDLVETMNKTTLDATPATAAAEAVKAFSQASVVYGRCLSNSNAPRGPVRCMGFLHHQGTHFHMDGNVIYKWQHGECEARATPTQEVTKAAAGE